MVYLEASHTLVRIIGELIAITGLHNSEWHNCFACSFPSSRGIDWQEMVVKINTVLKNNGVKIDDLVGRLVNAKQQGVVSIANGDLMITQWQDGLCFADLLAAITYQFIESGKNYIEVERG